MPDVERWTELRRENFGRSVSSKELVRRTGLARNTARVAWRSDQPPAFPVPDRSSKLEPFKDEIHRLLRDDPKLPGVRVRELIEPPGFDGGKTIVDDYPREIRPIFLRLRGISRRCISRARSFSGTSGSRAAGYGRHGQERRAWVVVACLGCSRAGAGALIFGKEAPDVLWGMTRCLWSLGGLLEVMVSDREGCLHARGGRPTEELCGVLRAASRRLVVLRAGRSAAEGVGFIVHLVGWWGEFSVAQAPPLANFEAWIGGVGRTEEPFVLVVGPVGGEQSGAVPGLDRAGVHTGSVGGLVDREQASGRERLAWPGRSWARRRCTTIGLLNGWFVPVRRPAALSCRAVSASVCSSMSQSDIAIVSGACLACWRQPHDRLVRRTVGWSWRCNVDTPRG